MDKNSKNRSKEIDFTNKFIINKKVNSISSNLSSINTTPHSKPIQTKISKLTIYESRPEIPAKFNVKSIHTRMNHDYQQEELINTKVSQSFKPRNINLKEISQDIPVASEKKILGGYNDCQNNNSVLNHLEKNEHLCTPPNNIKITNSHRSNFVDKPVFKSKQILSAIQSESSDKPELNNFAEDKFGENLTENIRIVGNENLLLKQMESTKLETVSENTYQNKILTHDKQKSKILVNKSNEQNELHRSKTDIQPTERSDFLQISPTKTVRSQSSVNLNTDCTTDRKKSYNPEQARRFMQEQKRKRKLTTQNGGEDIANDKEAIKKRLEDLRKHSLKILQRSVKIAKKKDPTPLQQYQEMPATSTTRKINGQMTITKAVNQRDEEKIQMPQQSIPIPVQLSAKVENPTSLEIRNSKVGLLRKETEDNSFSALNDKENKIFNTPRLNQTTEMLQKITDTINRKSSSENILSQTEAEKDVKFVENKKRIFNDANQNPNIYGSLRKTPNSSSKPLIIEGIELKVPDVKLNSKTLHNEKSVQCDSEDNQFSKQNFLPYWLKPSPIQIYPYNFIMAVRKKLEAITNPSLATNDSYRHLRTENNPKNTPVSHLTKNKTQMQRRIFDNKEEKLQDLSNFQKSECSSLSSNKVLHQKSRDNDLSECVISNPAIITQKPLHEKKNYNYSKSSTDTTSNFSSMSIHIPKMQKKKSNDLLSSTKIDGRNDDTTISSSIFSSPEKKTVRKRIVRKEQNKDLDEASLSPLSIETISNLKIKSKYLPDRINVDRRDNLLSNNNNNNNLQSGIVTNEVDFNQFLSDFNQSLSQVIEVNQQLKVTLDKSNQIINRKMESTQKQSDIKKDDYTSDFEEESINSSRKTEDLINLLPNELNQSNSQNSTIKRGMKTVSRDHSCTKSVKSNNNKNLEKHSTTDSEILEIITSDTLSRTISMSLKSSKDLRETSKNENSDHSANSYQNLKYKSERELNEKDKNRHNFSSKHNSESSPSTKSGSEDHSIKIVHLKQIESYSVKSNEFLAHNISQSNVIGDFDNENGADMIPEKLNEKPILNAKEIKQTLYKGNEAKTKILNSSASSEFIAIFNQSDFDVPHHSESNLTESTLNYSSIGLYEQLLQNENRKTEQLAAFLRMREKVILDRAKGQIAWLEVQREKIRSKKHLNSDETSQLINLKKRQRGILLKMERERDEIHKLLQNQSEQSLQSHSNKSKNRPKFPAKISDATIRKSVITNNISNSSRTSIVRGFELQGDTQKLEEILKKREEELRKRREYVERLMEWHQRLDREENEVLLIEKTLYNSNCNQITSTLSKNDLKKIKKLEQIDTSLRKIQNISEENESHKEISGSRLNKLWNRLTGRNDEKFISNKEYDINKYDLEKLYEEAKNIVSRDFNNDEFLEQFKLNRSGNTSSESHVFNTNQDLYGKENTASGNIINNEYFENKVQVKEDDTTSFIEIVTNPEELIISDKLKKSLTNLKITEDSSEKVLNQNSEESNIKNNTYLFQNNLESLQIEINTENEIISERYEPVSKVDDVEQPLCTEQIEPNTGSKRPSVIVSLQKSQEDLFETNETSNELFDELSIETKISKESTNASETLIEDLGRSNTAISLTSESGIFNNSNSYENINENGNLGINSNIKPTFVMNFNEIDQQIFEINSDMSCKSSLETIPVGAKNITNISESINSNTTVQSSELVRCDNEDIKTVSHNEDPDYENDIFESDTLIEDISSPKFECTFEESILVVDEYSKTLSKNCNILNLNDKEIADKDNFLLNELKNQSELEKRLIDIDDSLKDLTDAFEHALSPDKSLSPQLVNSAVILMKSPPLNDFNISSIKPNIPIKKITSQSSENCSMSEATQKMPDIISEVEIRRRQIFTENEQKQPEQAIPYYLNREIPNKPPPPYHSPAHGSPMTIIFPSENRIKEITFKRTKELYDKITKNDTENNQSSSESEKTNSILDENITNIYERIVLDICQEYINEYKKTLVDSNPEMHKNSLALFNPPDKLKCIQDCIYKNVRKSLGMDKLQQQPHNLIKNNYLYLIGKNNKRDNVDDILIQELYEEESKWVNFDIEEEQVKHAIIDEILNDIIKDVIDEIVNENIKSN